MFTQNGYSGGGIVRRRFSSLYKDRIGKAQIDSLAKSGGFKESSDEEGKLIVVADGDIVLNDVFNQQGPLPMGMNKYTIGSKYEYLLPTVNFY